MIAKLDSLVLDTDDLAAVRDFYRDALGFRVGTFEKDGWTVPDESDTYVNFDGAGLLLGFELGGSPQLATIVVRVQELEAALAELAAKGISPERRQPSFAVIRDPEGREILLQG